MGFRLDNLPPALIPSKLEKIWLDMVKLRLVGNHLANGDGSYRRRLVCPMTADYNVHMWSQRREGAQSIRWNILDQNIDSGGTLMNIETDNRAGRVPARGY